MILLSLIPINKETFVYSLYKKTPKYYPSLHIEYVTYNKRFWKIIKPWFSDKSKTSEWILLTENDGGRWENCTYIKQGFFNIVTSVDIPKFKN